MDRESLMARNVSVLARSPDALAGDQRRVENNPSTSMVAAPSPRADRAYLGNCQEITAAFGTGEADVPKAFSIALDHTPSKVQPRSGIKVTSGTSRLAVINEWHATPWTRTQIWLMASQDDISQEFLVI